MGNQRLEDYVPAESTLREIFKDRPPDWNALRRDLRVTLEVLHPALWRPGAFASREPPYGQAIPGKPLVLNGIPLNVVTDSERFDPICAKAVEELTPVINSPWAIAMSVAGEYEVSRYTIPMEFLMGPIPADKFENLGACLSQAVLAFWSSLQKDYLYGSGTSLWLGQEPDELSQFYRGLWQRKDGNSAASEEMLNSVDLGIAYLQRARRARMDNDDNLLAECSRVAISIFADAGALELARLVTAEYPDLEHQWKALNARRKSHIRRVDDIFAEGYAEWQSHAGLRLFDNGLLEPLFAAFTPAQIRDCLQSTKDRRDRLSSTNPYRLGFSWLEAIENRVGECVTGAGILATIIAWPLSSLSRYAPIQAIESLPSNSLWHPDERARTLATGPQFRPLARGGGGESTAADGHATGNLRAGEALLSQMHSFLDATLVGIRTFSRNYLSNL